MEVAQDYIELGHTITKVLHHCRIARSSYYYKPRNGQRGRKPYAKIYDKHGRKVSKEVVLDEIITLFSEPFVDYGSYKTYRYLIDIKSYLISKHIVYNIMKENNLTRKRYLQSSKKTKRNYVKDLIPQVLYPFQFFEFDIKYMWVQGKQRNIQVLTIIDVFSRMNLGQYIAYNIKSNHVINLFEKVIEMFGLPAQFTVRCDNGSQFIALEVQHYLLNKGITQEFTKPSTPQQNAHIESYHSIMERAVCQRVEFNDENHAREIMNQFRDFYNFERIHSGIEFTNPYNYLIRHEEQFNKSTTFRKSFLKVKELYVSFINSPVFSG